MSLRIVAEERRTKDSAQSFAVPNSKMFKSFHFIRDSVDKKIQNRDFQERVLWEGAFFLEIALGTAGQLRLHLKTRRLMGLRHERTSSTGLADIIISRPPADPPADSLKSLCS